LMRPSGEVRPFVSPASVSRRSAACTKPIRTESQTPFWCERAAEFGRTALISFPEFLGSTLAWYSAGIEWQMHTDCFAATNLKLRSRDFAICHLPSAIVGSGAWAGHR